MLKQRLLTASILIPLVLFSLYQQPALFCIILTSLLLVGAWEWSRLAGWHSITQRVIYFLSFLISLSIVYYLSVILVLPQVLFITLIVAMLWWLLATYWVIRYQQGHNLLPNNRWIKSLLGIFVLLPAWLAIQFILQISPHWVLLLFLLVWGADSGAYFAGKKWGKHKLATVVSPKKTWEGVYGALATALMIIALYAIIFEWSSSRIINFSLLAIATVFISVLGDLLESLFKRQAKVKDSGTLLPGHGGVLDRIDSLTAAAPLFALGLWLADVSSI